MLENFMYNASWWNLWIPLIPVFWIVAAVWRRWRRVSQDEYIHAQVLRAFLWGCLASVITSLVFLMATSTFIEYPRGEPLYARNAEGRWQVYFKPIRHEFMRFKGLSSENGLVWRRQRFKLDITEDDGKTIKPYEVKVSVQVDTDDQANTLAFLRNIMLPHDRTGLGIEMDDIIKKVLDQMQAELSTGQFLDDAFRNAYLSRQLVQYGMEFTGSTISLRQK